MDSKINNLNFKTEFTTSKNFNFDTFKYLKNLTFEQSANLTYFYNDLIEYEYYKFSWNFTYLDFKKLVKIKHSVKLWVKFKISQENFLFNCLLKNENKVLFLKELFVLKKNTFKNKWGRFKYIKYMNNVTTLSYLYLYKFFFNINCYSIFKKNKSIDLKLKYLTMMFQFFNFNANFFFLPVIELDAWRFFLKKFKINKRPSWLFRSIPRNKIYNKIVKMKCFNGILISNNKILNLQKLIFLNSSYKFDFEIRKDEGILFLNSIFKNKFLNISKVSNLINHYLLIFFLQFFNFKFFDSFFFIYFINIFINIFEKKTNFEKKDFFFKICLKLTTKFKFKYRSNERFTKSYLLWTGFKKLPFFSYIGMNNVLLKTSIGEYAIYNILIFKTFEIFKNPLVLLKTNFYPIKIFIKSNFYWTKHLNFFSLKFIINKTIETIFSKNYCLLSKSLKLMYYNTLIRFIPKLYYINKLKFTLSFPVNFSFIFNKYISLDPKSQLLNNFFFYNYSLFNINFFLYKIYFIIYDKFLGFSILLSNFEGFFFWKKLIFQPAVKELIIYETSFKLLNSCLFNLVPKLKRKLLKKLEKKLWFNYTIFGEELEHLIYESNYDDLEWVRELIRTKQLSEIWLIKLTNYLMKMRQLKIDVGNIQYGPDFTQQHEFALTLKWGMELEMLRYTRFIIMWRFFGWNNFIVKKNFIWKKINFLYNLLKSKNLKKEFNWASIFKPKVSKLLSLKNVYEITQLQLATIVTIYKNIYKIKTIQLDYFHTYFKINSETSVKDFYKFIFLVFERFFLINSYKKYYLKTKIKKKIRFSKMIYKKVFNWFVLSVRFHRNLIFLKNSFNYYFFRLFQSLKKNISKKIKSNYFYNTVYTLVYKFSKSFLIPTQKTLLDHKILNSEIQDLNLTFSNKFKLILSWDEQKFLDLKAFYFLKPELLKNNTIFKILNYNLINNKSFFFNLGDSFFEQTNNIFLNNENIKIFFQNFLSEFFYEIFKEFFLINRNLQKFSCKNKFRNSNLYSSLTSNLMSSLFFFLLEPKIIKYDKKLSNWIIWSFLIEFNYYLNNKKIFKRLRGALEKFIFNTKFNFFDNINIINNNSKIFFFINFIYSLLIKEIYKWKFINSILNSFIFRFLDFLKQDNSNFLFKKLHFDTFWFRNFVKQLELLIINFLFEFCNLSINRNIFFGKKIFS